MSNPRLESVDLNLLLALHWLLEERGVTRAAARVGLSQPAMSRALGRLREVFEDPLLVPAGRTMVPSARAESLRPELADAIARLRGLLSEPEAFMPDLAKGPIRIGCTDYLGLVLSRSWASHVTPAAPGLDLELRPLDQEASVQLANGSLDLVAMPDHVARVAREHSDLLGFERRTFFDERYVCVVNAKHPWAGRKPGLKRFASLDHVLVSPTQRGIGVVDEVLASRGLRRRVAYRVPTFLVAIEIVAATECVAVLPGALVRAAATRLATLEMPVEIPGFSVLLGWHTSRSRLAQHTWLRERLMASANSQARSPGRNR